MPEGSASVGHAFKPVCGRELAGSIPVRPRYAMTSGNARAKGTL